MSALLERIAGMGDMVCWDEAGEEVRGRVLTTDRDGCLVTRESGGQRILAWGQVRLQSPGPLDAWDDGGHLSCSETLTVAASTLAEVLTDSERAELLEAEQTIRQGRQTFLAVGHALRVIRDKRLYREKYRNFEMYLEEEWEMGSAHAYRLMDAAQVVADLSPIGELPTNEAQARELKPVPPEQRQQVWQEAVETAPDGRVTAAHVERVVAKALAGVGEEPEPESATKPPGHDLRPFRDATAARHPAAQHLNSGDDFQTPPDALEPLLPFVSEHWRVWEPASGQGQLVAALEAHGCKVYGSDLKRGEDFLAMPEKEHPWEYDAIITNPPYSQKDAWLAKCYELGKPFALLLPLTAMEGHVRQDLYRRHGLQVLLLPKRVGFTTPSGKVGGSWFASAWFTWGLNLPSDLCLPPRAEPPTAFRVCLDCVHSSPIAECSEWKRDMTGWRCPSCQAERSKEAAAWDVWVQRLAEVADVLHEAAYTAHQGDGACPLLDSVEYLLGIATDEPAGVEPESNALQLAVGDLVKWVEPFGDCEQVNWTGKVAEVGEKLVVYTTRPCIQCVEVDSASDLPGLRRIE